MKKNTTPKKLALNTVTVRMLQQDLSEDQLKQIAGGLPCMGSQVSRQAIC